MLGIKETKEALIGGAALLKAVEKVGADGYQFSDIFELIELYNSDAVFAQKLTDAFMDIKLVIPELQDLDILEVIALVRMIPDLLKFKLVKK